MSFKSQASYLLPVGVLLGNTSLKCNCDGFTGDLGSSRRAGEDGQPELPLLGAADTLAV